jgi:hypothetical protein
MNGAVIAEKTIFPIVRAWATQEILPGQQPIKLRHSAKQLLPYNKGLLIQVYLHFPGLTFMFQNKYLAAMRRNDYSYVDAAVHVAVSSITYSYILLTDRNARAIRYISRVLLSFVYGPRLHLEGRDFRSNQALSI